MIIDWLIDLNGYFFPFTIVLRKKKREGIQIRISSNFLKNQFSNFSFASKIKKKKSDNKIQTFDLNSSYFPSIDFSAKPFR